MDGALDRKVVHPADDDPADAVPEREREQAEEQRVEDVRATEPPVPKTNDRDAAGCRERDQHHAVGEPNVGGRTMPPSPGLPVVASPLAVHRA